jgi:hypothetical protein
MSQAQQGATYISGDVRFAQLPSTVTSYNVIWPAGGVAEPATRNPNSGDYVAFASTNANDTASGSGMRRIFFLGLGYVDEADVSKGFRFRGETLWLNGTTPTTSTYKYIGSYRMYGDRGATNVGSIFCGYGTFTSGVPANVLNIIRAGAGQTEAMLGFLPSSTEGHVHDFNFEIGRTGGGQDILADVRIRSRQITWVGSAWEFEPWRVRYIGASIANIAYSTEVNGFILQGPVEVQGQALGSAAGARVSGHVSYELHKDFQ